jgi:tetratricopeptide (TPR) repeat protein
VGDIREGRESENNQTLTPVINKRPHCVELDWDIDMPFPIQSFTISYGQINISVTLPDEDTVDFYNETDITGGIRAKMADWQLETEDFLYYHREDADKSFSHYREAAYIEPGNPVFRKNLADFQYIVNGDVQSALEIYVDLLANDPEDKEIVLVLGHICTEQEKFDDATVFYKRVLEIDPMNIDAGSSLDTLPG